MIILRDFQVDVISRVRQCIRNGKQRPLLQAATGAGKTVCASEIIRLGIEKGSRVLFIAHRQELVSQTSAKLDEFGIDHGVIMSDHPRYYPMLPVQVASIQTLNNRHKPAADIVILDEAHLSISKSFLNIVEHYKEAKIIGLTATPIRLDGKGLGAIYDCMEQAVSMKTLIDRGYLVPFRVFAPFNPDLSGIKTIAGDYDAGAAAEVMDKASITGDIVKHWLAHAANRKTIVFAASVKHSQHIIDAFNQAGIASKHLDAKTPKHLRQSILNDFKAGKFSVLSNCGLFIEGLDVPDIACVVLARPTQSLTIYMQSVGRGLRPAPNKTNLIILDHAGLTYQHGLVDEDRDWSLDGKKKKAKKTETEQVLNVTICESCFAAYSRSQNERCPECGTVPETKKRAVLQAGEGELIELDDAAIAQLKLQKKNELKAARTQEQLIELAKRRGYKYPVQWSKHILEGRKKFNASASTAGGVYA